MRLFQNSDFTSISKIRTWHVISVSFSPDGKTLVSGSRDKTIKLWNLGTDWGLSDLMGRSCDWVRAYLENNINVSKEDRHLCDGIGGK